MNTAEKNTLISIDDIQLDENKSLFVEGGLDEYKDLVKSAYEYVKAQDFDMSVETDRKALNSWLRKFGSLSSRVTKLGVEDRSEHEKAKKRSKAVEKDFTNLVDSFKAKLKEPLDKWNEKEAERVKLLESRVREITELGMARMTPAPELDSEQLKQRLDALKEITMDDSFEEFVTEAEEEFLLAKTNLEALYERTAKEEQQRAELEELKRKQAEAEREAEHKKMVEEAENRARKEAQEQAEAEKREAIEAVERETREKAEAEKRKREAEEAEVKRRAENKEHRAQVNRQALNDLVSATNIDEATAKRVIKAIAKGQVSGVTVNY